MGEEVTLLIKAANQSISDLKLNGNLNWTVLHLKKNIKELHPSIPNINEQRLIYCGHLLQDASLLKSVLRHPSENNVHIVHLVYSVPSQPTDNEGRLQSQYQSSVPSSILTNAASSSTGGLRQRNIVTENQPDSSIYQFQSASDPSQQINLMQQMYAQYMTSYMQYMQSMNPGMLMTENISQTSMAPHLFTAPPADSASSNEAVQERNQDQQEQPIVNNENELNRPNFPEQRFNAQAGVAAIAEEEAGGEGGPRDWLDHVYDATRMILLLVVVFFYSTFKRFFLVLGITVFIYLYQSGWFTFANNQQQRQRDERGEPPQQVEPIPPADNIAEEQQPNDPSARDGDPPRADIPEFTPQVRQTLPSLVWTFVLTFFQSIIPEQQQGRVI